MQSIVKTSYGLLLLALLLSGVELFAWFYLYQIGYLQTLITNDQSQVSIVIILVYLLATLHFLFACYTTSAQFHDLQNGSGENYRSVVLRRFYTELKKQTPSEKHHSLIEVLDTRVRSHYAFGFIIADLMLKLGILGTVIGFIIMLGSLSNLNSVDITVMQRLLAEMSGGMKVALFTTLAGMLAGILLNIKYNLVDWAVDHLVNDIRESLLFHD